jgi:hypothetical protein
MSKWTPKKRVARIRQLARWSKARGGLGDPNLCEGIQAHLDALGIPWPWNHPNERWEDTATMTIDTRELKKAVESLEATRGKIRDSRDWPPGVVHRDWPVDTDWPDGVVHRDWPAGPVERSEP